jgi:replicative DNA helicase
MLRLKNTAESKQAKVTTKTKRDKKNDMIELKNKVNKAATLRELEEKAFDIYRDCYEPETRMKDFMDGAKALFKLLRLGSVRQQSDVKEINQNKEG